MLVNVWGDAGVKKVEQCCWFSSMAGNVASDIADHYGQTKIQPMRLGTKGFLIDSFVCKQDKNFL